MKREFSEDVEKRSAPYGKTSRETGVVKWFSVAKGYGFITADGDGVDVFSHVTKVTGMIEAGDRVEFTRIAGAPEKGPKAIAVEKVK